jgi:pre-mRNA cleavage complex 2 protein Pcf11
MSLYSSQPNYGHPGYQHYPQAVSSQNYYYQYQQPPPPVYHHDPDAFRREYTRRLSELNVNSRPIIQNLSMFAQEYARFADIVVRCIDSHIRAVSVPFNLLFFTNSVAAWRIEPSFFYQLYMY